MTGSQPVTGALRLGTRGSPLARTQATSVVDALAARGIQAELVIVETEGDRRKPDTAWGEGAFVAALERALLDRRVDAAVHSAKDMPTAEDRRLRIAAYLERADPRDALVGRDPGATVASLPHGARVGSDSPRRTGFLLAQRPDLQLHPLNGNVDTRLRRLDDDETDALVLAVAGLMRLGRAERIGERLDPTSVPPAPGQGAIAVQVRADDRWAAEALAEIDHRPTRVAVETERAFLAAAGGGCRAPIGALAVVDGERLRLRAGYARPDGTATAVAEMSGHPENGPAIAVALAEALGERLPDVARSLRTTGRVLVTRPQEQARPFLDALAARGLEPLLVPAIDIEPVAPGGALDDALRDLSPYTWVAVTSANAARAILAAADRTGASLAGPRWAAVGAATASALEDAGVRVDLLPRDRSSGADLAAVMPLGPGDRVLLPRADIADDALPAAVRSLGASVDDVVAYRTVEAPPASRELLASVLDGPRVEALVFTSGSTVRGLAALARALDEGVNGSEDGALHRIRTVPAICIGPRTAAEARRAGFTVVSEAGLQAVEPLADLVAAVARRST